MSETDPTAYKAPQFSDSFGLEMIHIRFISAPKGCYKSYYIHANKLKAESAYLAAFLEYPNPQQYPGIESNTTTITLTEGFEGLQTAFEAFIEYLYLGSYYAYANKHRDLLHQADILALSERLSARRFKTETITHLTRLLRDFTIEDEASPSDIAEFVTKTIALIKKIYNSVPRPYQRSEEGRNTLASARSSLELTSAEGLPLAEQHRHRARAAHGGTVMSILLGYRNCRARKLVAEHAARHLKLLRQLREFRAVVEEVGEFACDLMMECLAPGGDGKSGADLVEITH